MTFDELFSQLDDNTKVDAEPEKVKMAKKAIRIPVLGNVAAGVPIEAIEDVIDYEEISEELAHTGDFFALKIKGDSMEPRICNGDVVIVRKQNYAESGDLVIVLVNGDLSLIHIFSGVGFSLPHFGHNPLSLISLYDNFLNPFQRFPGFMRATLSSVTF